MSFPSGTWYNELGSTMTLSISGNDVRGTYVTAVGEASGTYELVGRIDTQPAPGTDSLAIGWSVVWQNNIAPNAHSLTSWSGQYQIINGEEEIIAFWLLTTEQNPQNDWEATQIGKDIFTRTPPHDEHIEYNRKRTARSNP